MTPGLAAEENSLSHPRRTSLPGRLGVPVLHPHRVSARPLIPRLSLAPYPPSRRNHHTASQASGEPAPPVQVLPRNGRDLRPAAVLLPLENSGRAAARPHGQGRGYHHPCASFQQPPLPQYSAPPPPSHATPGSTAPPSSYQSQRPLCILLSLPEQSPASVTPSS